MAHLAFFCCHKILNCQLKFNQLLPEHHHVKNSKAPVFVYIFGACVNVCPFFEVNSLESTHSPNPLLHQTHNNPNPCACKQRKWIPSSTSESLCLTGQFYLVCHFKTIQGPNLKYRIYHVVSGQKVLAFEPYNFCLNVLIILISAVGAHTGTSELFNCCPIKLG